MDHGPAPKAPFECQNPSFPNPGADYNIHLSFFNSSLIPLFFSGLQPYKILSLSIESNFPEEIPNILNLEQYFPNLVTLSLKNLNFSKKKLNIFQLFGKLENLEHLILKNFDFDFGLEPKWIKKISKIHIENSSLKALPKWLIFAENLRRLTIQKTRLENAMVISQLKNLILLNLDDNFIEDLYGVSFSSKDVLEISLKNNKVSYLF